MEFISQIGLGLIFIAVIVTLIYVKAHRTLIILLASALMGAAGAAAGTHYEKVEPERLHQYIAGFIFIVVFGIIISEKIHRTIIALVGAVIMVLVGMYLGFYSQGEALKAIDFNTIGLLMGMMIIVNMLKRTGFFEYLATIAAKKTKGSPWLLMLILGSITTFVSMVIDNVTTVVLMVPITIIVAEIIGINPLPILLAEALLSNTGGTATLIGDPPNIMIGTAANLSFNDFLVKLFPIVMLIWVSSVVLLKFVFRKELREKPRNIEALLKLDEKQALKDPKSLKKILFSLAIVLVLFFIHHIFHFQSSFVALIGAAISFLWVRPHPDEILKEVEWTVLLFFACLFVVVGGVEKTGLLDVAAEQIGHHATGSLIVTTLIIIWVSAFLSAIIDNIPFTMAMIPVLQHLETQGINITPLWWALALGVGFGGNGTPIGSSAGVVTMAMSERTKFPITFRNWFKSGSILMIANCIFASILVVVFFKFLSTPR
ncbi:MAG TPA: SLC13 family permease [Candidatus Brocadiia bacterium]|nr:ArsB/NhaD family transporter [Planctomycetota bacterium]MDO8092607.1 ArsB/NhaD family transporter [Candidatus Brocadiales bacterium]